MFIFRASTRIILCLNGEQKMINLIKREILHVEKSPYRHIYFITLACGHEITRKHFFASYKSLGCPQCTKELGSHRYKTHFKSKKHIQFEESYGTILNIGLFAYCRTFKIGQMLTSDPEKVTCLKCLTKLKG